ncbi:MAG: CHAP domain-containing protein [Eubacteriales bacterium]|nr:CHAP domain-containing protein [Eubacteriales bacterium]
MVDQYRVSWKADSAKQWTRITEFCSALKLKLDADSAYSELTFTYPRGKADPNLEDLGIEVADKIVVWNTATNTKIFDGCVTKVDFSGAVTCKDQGFYLKNPIYLKATKKRTDTVLKSICSKAGVTYGGTKLATKITVSFSQKSASDCIQEALEMLEEKTNRRYWAHFVDKKLIVSVFQTAAHTIEAHRNPDWNPFDCTTALTNISGSVSMEDYVSLVYAVTTESSKTKAYAKAKYNDGYSKYGKLVEYVTTDSKSEAASTARKVLVADAQLSRDFKCTMYASDDIVPGVRLKFDGGESADIKGEFWVTAAEHDLTYPHTVSVTLERTKADYVKATVSSMNSTLFVSDSTSSTSSSGTTTVYTGKTVSALYTAYYPGPGIEGGYKDCMGNNLKTTYLNKGVLACAAPKSVKLKSKIQVKGTGTSKDGKVYLVVDRGGAITVKNGVYHFDLLMSNKSQANSWGKRTGKALLITGSKTVTSSSSSSSGGSATAQKVLAYAKSQMGKNLNPGFAWCAWFVSRCCRQCGVPTSVVPSNNAVSGFLSWAKSHGRYHPKGSGYVPQPGDIFIEKNKKSHTGFVYKVSSNGKSYTTIEGNASNRVRSHSRTTSYSCLSGFFHPDW